MDKKTLKGFIAGTLAGIITVCSVPVVADSIQAVVNSVNIKLNGDKVASVNKNYTLQNGTTVPYSILYEGTTYLPIRKVSELLDIGIGWDNDTRTVLIETSDSADGYDSWYGAPDFGEISKVKQIAEIATVHSTTHWYEAANVKAAQIDKYVEELEKLGYERVTEGGVKPKFKVYQKGNIEVWLDLGMYKDLVYGITVMDSTRPFCSREYEFSGKNEDVPDFNSAYGFSYDSLNGMNYTLGYWELWSCLPDYFCLLDSEGFEITGVDSGYYGKGFKLRKDKSSVYIKFDGSKYSNIPAVVVDY